MYITHETLHEIYNLICKSKRITKSTYSECGYCAPL